MSRASSRVPSPPRGGARFRPSPPPTTSTPRPAPAHRPAPPPNFHPEDLLRSRSTMTSEAPGGNGSDVHVEIDVTHVIVRRTGTVSTATKWRISEEDTTRDCPLSECLFWSFALKFMRTHIYICLDFGRSGKFWSMNIQCVWKRVCDRKMRGLILLRKVYCVRAHARAHLTHTKLNSRN